jgi:hypothetical protein
MDPSHRRKKLNDFVAAQMLAVLGGARIGHAFECFLHQMWRLASNSERELQHVAGIAAADMPISWTLECRSKCDTGG